MGAAVSNHLFKQNTLFDCPHVVVMVYPGTQNVELSTTNMSNFHWQISWQFQKGFEAIPVGTRGLPPNTTVGFQGGFRVILKSFKVFHGVKGSFKGFKRNLKEFQGVAGGFR